MVMCTNIYTGCYTQGLEAFWLDKEKPLVVFCGKEGIIQLM